MRIAIREQLAALVILAVLVALAIVSIPTWIYVNNFVITVESGGLALTASLKAARISSEIDLVQTTVQTISTRLLLQNGFTNYYNKNATDPSGDPWVEAREDLESALSASGFSGLLQARLYSRNITGEKYGLLNLTGNAVTQNAPIVLPYKGPDGRDIYLGDTEQGYPPSLYPTINYIDLNRTNSYMPTQAYAATVFPGVSLGNGSEGNGVLLGPLVINDTFALISITIPVRMISNNGYILGYMTIVASATSLIDVQVSNEGLGNTGIVLLVGPINPWNHFNDTLAPTNETFTAPIDEFSRQPVQFLLPPPDPPTPGLADRHSELSIEKKNFDAPWAISKYPAVLDVFWKKNTAPNNADSDLTTTNEQGFPVAVGVARPQTSLVTWAVVVEQDQREAFEPIRILRSILLGCVFGTAGLVLFLVFPCAHLSVMPIRRLKSATEKSIAPPGYEDETDEELDEENPSSGGTTSGRSEKGLFASIRRKIRKRRKARLRAGVSNEPSRRQFKIPARVEDRKHLITDELTELTQTFNEMTDELVKQYTLLDEKVAERTRELEISKKAAEAANESKTLFIANISHELKTPLNGIMGMCAVCMEEDDINRIKQSLKTLYKSGRSLSSKLMTMANTHR